ncbi:ribose-5-phosphate isomerase RpiA [Sphingomonas sp. RP10(2022)]|uniref:Ribose-5-phosphate isomerase A n=1 Tax=Sphingomonas liriopis TaxID=2949094 RepID=A0A9X2HTK6_9SPHN|nr:ribose-5-phosphate isomerase RpiA [Sphingomonas liriopis]MCP3735224.1 ribose-5-phosphate isomerase RpiA [Sphingomonas liriopis]
MMDRDAGKALAAGAAVAEVTDGMLVGLGTGSTAAHVIRLLGARVAQGLRITAVATSRASAAQAEGVGIRVLDFADVPRVDLTIDGADQIDARLFAIKGAGGAMLREKVVAAASDRMVVIADRSKRVAAIGDAPVPVEILPFARAALLAALGEGAVLRMRDGAPYVTDNGNQIVDCRFDLADPAATAAWLDGIPGVLGHGLFLTEVDAAYIAADGVVSRLERATMSR